MRIERELVENERRCIDRERESTKGHHFCLFPNIMIQEKKDAIITHSQNRRIEDWYNAYALETFSREHTRMVIMEYSRHLRSARHYPRQIPLAAPSPQNSSQTYLLPSHSEFPSTSLAAWHRRHHRFPLDPR